MVRKLAAIATLVWLFPAAPAVADRLDSLHALNDTDYFVHQSPGLGRPFHIYVKVPKNPDRGTAKLPVVYLLDGGETFPILAAYAHYLTFAEEMPEAMIVVFPMAPMIRRTVINASPILPHRQRIIPAMAGPENFWR
jgi:Putative esterase